MQMASYGSDCCCTRVLAGIVEQYIVPAALLCKDLSSSKPALAQASNVKLRCGPHLTCEVDCDFILVNWWFPAVVCGVAISPFVEWQRAFAILVPRPAVQVPIGFCWALRAKSASLLTVGGGLPPMHVVLLAASCVRALL